MPRALSDIMTELDSTYNPLRNRSQEVYQKGLDATNPQESADLGGLEIAKNNAFESINTGANRRGMFFSGIPLAEQSKYVGENYLPSIAGLKNRYAGIRGNLYQTLAAQLGDIDTKQREFGQGIYNSEVQADIERERIAADERNAAAARAASGSGGGFVPSGATTSNGKNTGVLGASVSVKPEDQLLYNQMFIKSDGSAWDDNALASDYNATLASARRGNARDIRKIEMYHAMKPGLFGAKPAGLYVNRTAAPGATSLPVGSGAQNSVFGR